MLPGAVPLQARVPALSPAASGYGSIRNADTTEVLATSLAVAGGATLDASAFTTVWTEGFDTGFGRLSRVWGDVKVANSEATLKSSAATGWQSAGMMVPPTGPDAGDGYGLYTITARIDKGEGPGAFACLWPSTDVWPGPEIDLFEKASTADNSGYSTVHWMGSDGSDNYEVFRFPTTIDMSVTHSYALDWAADHLSLYIDGALIYSTNANVPLDYADGGQNSAFGAGMQPGWAASQQAKDRTNVLHVYDMSYAAPNGGSVGSPTISASGATATEGGSLAFTIKLSAAASAPVTVAYATADGTATAGADYAAASGTLTFAPGEISRTLLVQTFDDSAFEGQEHLLLRLAAASGATLANAEATGIILDDDPMPGLVVTGTGRNNTLVGTAGDDTITGGPGNDTMTGLAGADLFVLAPGDGFDRIKDFTPGTDKLVLLGVSPAEVTVKAATYARAAGTDVFYGGTDHVFLIGVAPGAFSTATDAVFT